MGKHEVSRTKVSKNVKLWLSLLLLTTYLNNQFSFSFLCALYLPLCCALQNDFKKINFNQLKKIMCMVSWEDRLKKKGVPKGWKFLKSSVLETQ